MRILGISTKTYIVIFLALSIFLAVLKTNYTYSTGRVPLIGGSQTYHEIFKENILVNKDINDLKLEKELSKVFEKINISEKEIYIENISVNFDEYKNIINFDEYKNIIRHISMNYYHNSGGYMQKKSLQLDGYYDNKYQADITQISLYVQGSYVKIPRPQVFKGNEVVAVLSTFIKNDINGILTDKTRPTSRHIGIQIVDLINSGVDYQTLENLNKYYYIGSDKRTVKYLEYLNGTLSNIENIKGYKTSEPTKILRLDISKDREPQDVIVIVR